LISGFFNLIIFETRRVKSGLSTLNKISGLKSIIFFTVSFILLFILKIFNNMSVKAMYAPPMAYGVRFQKDF